LPCGIYHHRYGVCVCGCDSADTSDKGFWRCKPRLTDANGISLTSFSEGADINVIVSRTEITARAAANADVVIAGTKIERPITDGCVVVSGAVAEQRFERRWPCYVCRWCCGGAVFAPPVKS
jgi:hypothetical protein